MTVFRLAEFFSEFSKIAGLVRDFLLSCPRMALILSLASLLLLLPLALLLPSWPAC